MFSIGLSSLSSARAGRKAPLVAGKANPRSLTKEVPSLWNPLLRYSVWSTLTLSLIPIPIVEERAMERTYVPLAADGFAFMIAS